MLTLKAQRSLATPIMLRDCCVLQGGFVGVFEASVLDLAAGGFYGLKTFSKLAQQDRYV